MDEPETTPVQPPVDEDPHTFAEFDAAPPAGQGARYVLLSVIATIVILGVGYAGYKLLSAQKEEPVKGAIPPLRTAVRVEPAARQTYRETLTGYGRARALRSAQVSAELAARVTWVSPRLEAGNVVADGEELVRLDDADALAAARSAEARSAQAAAAVARARADLESIAEQLVVARRELETSQRELERIRGMVPAAASPSELDRQQLQTNLRETAVLVLEGRERRGVADVRWNEADGAAATAALDKARIDVSRTSIVAPYAGTIGARGAREGARVVPGTVLFDIVDLTAVEIPVSLPASRFGEVRIGARAVVRLREGGDVVWTGAISRISPTVDAATRTFEALAEIRAESGAAVVPPGSFVVTSVEGPATDDVIVVPRIAFVGEALYVASVLPDAPDEALVEERKPTVRRWLAESVLVESGIEPGDKIIVTNVEQIAAGSHVRLLREAEAAR